MKTNYIERAAIAWIAAVDEYLVAARRANGNAMLRAQALEQLMRAHTHLRRAVERRAARLLESTKAQAERLIADNSKLRERPPREARESAARKLESWSMSGWIGADEAKQYAVVVKYLREEG